MELLAPPADPVVQTDVEFIQGVWTTVAGRKEARLLIAGHRFTFEFIGGDVYMGTFALSPGRMDMHIDEGPAEHVGRVSRCIYQLEGGVLRWCAGRPGTDQRPTAFPDVDDPCSLSLVFRQVRRNGGR
jgi:uncharacterized protein (TIGR03067 family)